MIYLVIFDVILIVICYFIAKKMVASRTGPVKNMVIGKDDEKKINEMENLVRKIILTGKFEMSDEFSDYRVNIKAAEGCIGEVLIESLATRVSWHYVDGWKTKNFAYTEKSAVGDLAICLWLIAFAIQLIIWMFILIL